jgi:hypothetical protein
MKRTHRLPLCISLMVISFVMMTHAVQAQDAPPAEVKPEDKPWVDFDKTYQLKTPEKIQSMDPAEAKAELQQKTAKESKDLGAALSDFKRGAGVGITVAPRGKDRIDEAVVVDGKIVVTQQNTNAARLMFEFHQLFTTNILTKNGRAAARRQLLQCEANPIDCPMYGIGPFLALQTSQDDLIASVGLGIMMGVRNDPRKNTSFNFGIGVQWDSKVKELANGFVAGQPLPTGEKNIRFKESGQARLMVAISLGF